MLRGTFTALVSPFDSSGALDEPALIRLIERQLGSCVDGLVLFSTTGEEATLTSAERLRIVEVVQKRAEGHLFVVAGAFDSVTSRAVELAREMDWVGVDAILSVLPYSNRPSQAGIVEHFRRVVDSVGTPVLLSNVPDSPGPALALESVLLLAEHENIRGLVATTPDLDFVTQILSDTDEHFGVFCGKDSAALPMLAVGGDGAFSTVSNVTPQKMTRLVAATLEGRLDDARVLHHELFPLMRASEVDTSPIPIKAALAMMGLVEESYRLPLTPLADEGRDILIAALDELRLLEPDSA